MGSTTLSMVSVVLTAARESVELEATGSTPAGHPQCKLGGGDDDPERAGAPHAGPEPELATGPRHDRGPVRALVMLWNKTAKAIPMSHNAPASAQVGAIFRGVLLGEQRASKTRGQGSNPCAPAIADVAER